MESKIIERIRRCLALHLSAGDTPEGRTAYERAVSISQKAGIDLSTVKITTEVKAERFFYEPSANSMWRSILANSICQYVGMEMLRDKNKFHLIGRSTDLENWKAFYTRAEYEIEEEGKRWVKKNGGGKSDGDTFRKGAALGFGDRLDRHKKESEGSKNGMIAASIQKEGDYPLVMVSRGLEVTSLKDRLYPKTKSVSIQSRGSLGSRDAGYSFGQGMGVHKGLIK